jgi:hypothetical protein
MQALQQIMCRKSIEATDRQEQLIESAAELPSCYSITIVMLFAENINVSEGKKVVCRNATTVSLEKHQSDLSHDEEVSASSEEGRQV